MFTIHDEAFYDPETDELQRFYGPTSYEDIHEEVCEFFEEYGEYEEGDYEPDPDAQLEEYHWRLSAL